MFLVFQEHDLQVPKVFIRAFVEDSKNTAPKRFRTHHLYRITILIEATAKINAITSFKCGSLIL